jgi:hypothetical protein
MKTKNWKKQIIKLERANSPNTAIAAHPNVKNEFYSVFDIILPSIIFLYSILHIKIIAMLKIAEESTTYFIIYKKED